MQTLSIRPFIGAKDYDVSRSFYTDLGFEEIVITPVMSLFKTGNIGFYLQRYYVRDWIDNMMLFVEVPDADKHWEYLLMLGLPEKYPGAKLVPVKTLDWGKECFVHDPSGVLWHFGHFNPA